MLCAIMRIPVTLLLAAAAFLVLVNLGHVAFWDDEAHVALFGRALLASHHNLAWDGRNLVPSQNGSWLDKDLLQIFPQLDNYVAAASFAVFGDSPWAGRLPFALCGIASLVVFWRLLLLEFPGFPTLQLYALACASLSAPLLLYFRNCRYYGLSVLLTMTILLLYRRFLQSRRMLDAVLIGLLAGVLSLNSVLNCACLVGALVLRHLLFHRRELSLRDWLKISVTLLIGAAFTIPYVLTCIVPMFEPVREYSKSVHLPPNFPLREFLPLMLWRNINGINEGNALPWSLGLCLLAFIFWKHPKEAESAKSRQMALELLTMVVGFVLVLSTCSPQNAAASSLPDVRYLTPILPVIAALMGVVFWWIHQRSRIVAATLLLTYLCTNLLGTTPSTPGLRYPLPEFCLEILNPYPTACSETCDYLRANSRQDDTLWFYPDWMGKPLMYYIGDRIKLRGILDQNTFLPKPAAERLEPDFFIENVFPNWVVSFGRHQEVNSTVAGFCRTLPGTNTAYHYTRVKVIDVYWDQIQRPELAFHSFGPWHGFDKAAGSVYIFKRSETPLPR